MSALFNLQSLLTVVLLVICTCAYLKSFFPKVFDKSRTGSYTKDLLEMCKDRRKKVALGSSGMFDDGIYNTVFKVNLINFHVKFCILHNKTIILSYLNFRLCGDGPSKLHLTDPSVNLGIFYMLIISVY
ncbi:hypothetical protein YQE_06483, partial [Dendroctonus ponderosae]